MLYLTGSLPSKPEIVRLLDEHGVGIMTQPSIGYSNNTLAVRPWALDNGCFAKTWDAAKWLAFLDKRKDTPGCLFAVVPDVVGDHQATMNRWRRWRSEVTSRGFRAAFVAQNGCDVGDVPWDECDAVFIGGDDAYKLGQQAERIVRHAKHLGKWAHMGRVNSLRRLRIAADWGCDSVDGTFLAFGPDVNTPRLVAWLKNLATQPTLWSNA